MEGHTEPEYVVLPTGISYTSIGVNGERVSCVPKDNEIITLSTDLNYECEEWDDDGYETWQEPRVRHHWETLIEDTVSPARLARTSQNEDDLEVALSNIKQLVIEGPEGREANPSFPVLYDSVEEEISRLYGALLNTVNEASTRSMGYAASHIPAREDSTKPAYTENDIRRIAERISRAHIVAVLENQVEAEVMIKDMEAGDIEFDDGETPEARESIKKSCVDSMLVSARAYMDRSILGGGRTSLVWDETGGRMTFVTSGLLEPAHNLSFRGGSANGPLMTVEEHELQSFVALNNEGGVAFEDAIGRTFGLDLN
ncbi:hypothetical protein IAR50_000905 [Cryptococcus sp. DSM 104548]